MPASTTHTGRFRVGIIGAGGITERHALAYESLPDHAVMVGVADIAQERAEAVRTLYGMEAAYSDYKELIARDDIDLVSICTRPNLHAQVVIDAVRAGKHVLCEKPLAHTLADTDEIIAVSDQHPDVKISCLYQWRTDPAMTFVRSLVQEGALGRMLMADIQVRTWRPERYYDPAARRESWDLDGGGVLIVIGIHQLDSLIDLFGDPALASGQMSNHLGVTEGEDTLVGSIRFKNGALASVSATVGAHEDYFSIELIGEDASVKLVGGGLTNNFEWELHARSAASERARRPWELEAPSGELEQALRQRGRDAVPRHRFEPGPLGLAVLRKLSRLRGRPWVPPKHWWHTPYVRHFLEALSAGGPVPIPPREARRSLELTTAMYQACLSGSVVGLPLDAETPIYAGVKATGVPGRATELGEVG